MFRHLPLAALALPLLASSAWAQTTLKEAAAAVGLNIGIATNSNQVNTATSAYATAAKGQFNMVVCENEMKFESTERTIGQFTYTGGDNVHNFAAANQMKMRGHTFIWHSQSILGAKRGQRSHVGTQDHEGPYRRGGRAFQGKDL